MTTKEQKTHRGCDWHTERKLPMAFAGSGVIISASCEDYHPGVDRIEASPMISGVGT
jgi:hypothetical protein